ncbi:MAG: hypothetical protein ABIT58_07380, partial [Ferruginibacter sp.]
LKRGEEKYKKYDGANHIVTMVLPEVKNSNRFHNEKSEPEPINKKIKAAGDPSFASKNKTVQKEKGKSGVKIQAGETGTLVNNDKEKDNITDISMPENYLKNENHVIVNADKVANNENLKTEKILVIDSLQTKLPFAITTDENKTEKQEKKNTVNKPAKKHAWFIDLAVSPVVSIQQYDKAVTFSRTRYTGNNLSVFSGKLLSTSIDPSAAFSVSVRREMSKRLSLGFGIQYLQLSEHIKISGTETNTRFTVVDRLISNINGPQVVSDTVKTITQGNRQIVADNSYHFLSIPVSIQYILIQKRHWSLGIVAGVHVNVYSKYINEINKNTSAPLIASSQPGDAKTNIGFSLYGGLRFGKRIGNRMELFGTPSITWAAGKQNIKNSLLDKKIQSAGLSIGLSYQIK